MAGGAAALISFLAAIAAGALPHSVRGAIGDVLVCGIAALPVGMGVAILRYRLYEIDRIISRTLAYTIVTGLLVGVYAGLVLLATRALSVSSPVAVAASTLAAAALFTPVRRRVQQVVDHPVQPGPVRRGPHDRGVRRPAEGRGGPGDGPRRSGRRGAPGSGTRPRLGVDKRTRVALSIGPLPGPTRTGHGGTLTPERAPRPWPGHPAPARPPRPGPATPPLARPPRPWPGHPAPGPATSPVP